MKIMLSTRLASLFVMMTCTMLHGQSGSTFSVSWSTTDGGGGPPQAAASPSTAPSVSQTQASHENTMPR